MRFRSLRTAHTVTVVPLLGVSPSVTPSGSDLQQYMMRLDVDCDRVSHEWVDGCLFHEGGLGNDRKQIS